MPRPFLYAIPLLNGGLNESSPEMIEDSESAQLDNWYVDGVSVFQRPGLELLGGPHTEEILHVALYDPDPSVAGDEIVLLFCKSTIAKLDGTAITLLTVADSRVYPSSTNRWWAAQYNDEMFACQKGNAGVKRIFGSSVIEAGIEAPTVEPTVIDGGPGKKLPGTYRWVYRFFNQNTGARGNWSPFSKELELEELRQGGMSEIAVSGNPQVNARQIGATQPNGGVIFLVGQINDNVSTTFLENALSPEEYGEAGLDVLGNQVTDVSHGRPPDQATALEIHKERLFVMNKRGLHWSEPGLMQSFKAASFLPITRGTGVFSWDGHGLVLPAEKDTQILLGDTPSDWRVELLSKNHGSPAGRSLAVGDGILFWYTGVNIVASDGSAPRILPNIQRVRATLDSIPNASKDDVIGETIPSRGWYMLSVPTATVRKVIVFDYRAGKFVGVFPSGPKTIVRLLRENATQDRVYAAFPSNFNLYDYLQGTTDDGTVITATLKTKNFGQENQGTLKGTRRVNILSPAIDGTIQIRVLHDGAVVATRSGLSLNSAGWKRFGVSASGQPGSLVQVELEYAGTVQCRLDQLQIEGVLLSGRRPIPA